MSDDARTANLLGATALVVGDLMLAGATAAVDLSRSGAAALVTLDSAPGLAVTELGRRVGLSQPAAARMVDALEARGLVERRRGLGRWVAVHLTDLGSAAAHDVLSARGGRLTELVGRLEKAERAQLEILLGRLLDLAYDEVSNAQLVCRLCDRAACLAADAECPVGAAERERGG